MMPNIDDSSQKYQQLPDNSTANPYFFSMHNTSGIACLLARFPQPKKARKTFAEVHQAITCLYCRTEPGSVLFYRHLN